MRRYPLVRWCKLLVVVSIVVLLAGNSIGLVVCGAQCTAGESMRIRTTVTVVGPPSANNNVDSGNQRDSGSVGKNEVMTVPHQQESSSKLASEVDTQSDDTGFALFVWGIVSSFVSVVRDAVESVVDSFSVYCFQ